MKHHEITVIIVTHNSETYIQNCLEALLHVSYKPIHISVVDTASTDGTKRIVDKYKHVHTLYLTENVGFAAANNEAWEAAQTEFICLLNPDTVVEPGFFEPLVQAMNEDEHVGACQPIVYLLKNRSLINLTGKKTHFLGFDWIDGFKTTTVPKEQEIVSFSGSGVLLRSSAVQDVGFFDPRYFMYYEDSDLSWRMRLRGWKTMFIPASKMFHDYKYVPEKGGLRFSHKIFLNERNRLSNLFKNYRLWTLLLISPAFIVTEFGLLVVALTQGWFVAKISAYLSFLYMLPWLIQQRMLVQEKRTISDKKITREFESAITFEKFQHPLVRRIANPVLTWYWGVIRHII